MFLLAFSIFFAALSTPVFADDIIPVNTASDLKGRAGHYRLDSDIALSSSLTLRGDDYILDLNGHTLTLASTAFLRVRDNVTIMDSSNGSGMLIGGHPNFAIQVGGSVRVGGTDEDPITEPYDGHLTIESGNYITMSDTLRVIQTYNSSTLTINGGNIATMWNDERVVAIYNSAGSTVTINGGTVAAPQVAFYNFGDAIMEGGLVYSMSARTFQIMENATLVQNDGIIRTDGDVQAVNLSKPGAKFTMNGGKIYATSDGGAGVAAFKESEFIMNGGFIETSDIAIVTNGSVASSDNTSINAKITINDGTINSGSVAIYIPHINGVTNINGGTITGAVTALEIRAGTLNITGGTLIGGNDYSVQSNLSGTTTNGAAVAIAQHNTKQPIIVNICGGTFRAAVPFSETNPQGNDPEFTETIEGYISNSCSETRFESTSDKTIVSEDIEKFIEGGLFTHNVEAFVADGYGVTAEGDVYAVYPIHRAQLVYFKNGNATLSTATTLQGEPVNINATPDDGYELAGISVANSQGDPVQDSGDSYIAPDDDTFVWVAFRAVSSPAPTPDPTPDPTPAPDPTPVPVPTPSGKDTPADSTTPRTNDNVGDYVALFGVCAAVLVLLGIRRKLVKDSTL
ncbi:hypothetical protein J6X13_03975 [Candidatus Saccharibacteria bacterium]|nr:hypothetical protein [Candidatus Saccharibacteria bacterium]